MSGNSSNNALPAVIANGVPFAIGNTGTVAANGAITLGTALPLTYANIYIFLPAGAAFAGSAAGWYFCQMSSTTVGTIFNNLYVSGNPTIPASPTAIVAAGPGAYTGVTTAQTGPSIALASNSFGLGFFARVTAQFTTNNSAGNKTVKCNLAGTSVYSKVLTTVVNTVIQTVLFGRGSVNSQVAQNAGELGPSSTTNAVSATTLSVGSTNGIDVAPVFAVNMTLAVATDVVVCEGYCLEVYGN